MSKENKMAVKSILMTAILFFVLGFFVGEVV